MNTTRGTRSAKEQCLLDALARQAEIVADLEARATAAVGETERCLAWMGVERQARRYQRVTRPWGRWFGSLGAELDHWGERFEAAAMRAAGEVAAAEIGARAAATRRLGVRVAVVGKGGAGKSMISGTLARLLARRGRRVLAADLDMNPGLAYSLGVGRPAAGTLLGAAEQHEGATYGWQLAPSLTPAAAVERFSAPAPDGVRLVSIGKIDDIDKRAPRRTTVAVRQVLFGFGEPDWDIVGDMEAGPTTPFERHQAFADVALVVVGPAWRSALTARRLIAILDDMPHLVVANRFRDEPDHPRLEPVVRIPFDPDVAEAERYGLAPLDHCPGSPAVEALESLTAMLLPKMTEEVHR